MAIVTMPTELKPLPEFVTSSAAANQTTLITDLSTPDWSTHKQSSLSIVTMPTELKPLPQFVTSSVAANQTTLITDLSTPDWSTVLSQVQAGTQPTVLDPVTQTQSPVSSTGTICDVTSAPRMKKVIRLVVKRPTSSTVSQSQSCTSIVGRITNSTCPYHPPKLNNVMIASVADANSTSSLHSAFSSQELVTVQEYK